MKTHVAGPLVLALSASLLAGCSSHSPSSDAASGEIVPVRVATVQSGALSSNLELSGSLVAVHSVTLGAATPGRIVAVNVRVGDHVDAGQVIAQVDPQQYQAQVAQAQAGVSVTIDSAHVASARLAAAQSAYRLASMTAQRMERLYSQGAISLQQLNETQANLSGTQAGVAQAQAGMQVASSMGSQARAGVDVAAVALQNATVIAPFAGVITQKMVQPGAVVGPGTPIATIEDPSQLEIDVAVPDADATSIMVGSPVLVHVDSANNVAISGRVRAIVPSQNPALRSAMVKISVPSTPGVIAGMFARIGILGAATRAMSVPFSAITTRAEQTGVFLIDAKIAHFIPITTESIHADRVAIANNVHLPIGSRIAISAVQRLTDGTSVQVTP